MQLPQLSTPCLNKPSGLPYRAHLPPTQEDPITIRATILSLAFLAPLLCASKPLCVLISYSSLTRSTRQHPKDSTKRPLIEPTDNNLCELNLWTYTLATLSTRVQLYAYYWVPLSCYSILMYYITQEFFYV
jgi:hypothetical protein